jgi:acyl carrier protein
MQRKRYWPQRGLAAPVPSAEEQAIDALARKLKDGGLPRAEVAAALLDLVRRSLHIDDLRSDQSLLEVGATSVDLLQAIARVERATGFKPRVEDVFGEPTVDGMARLYEAWLERPEMPGPPGHAELQGWLRRLVASTDGQLPYITPLGQPLIDLLLIDAAAPTQGWHFTPLDGSWQEVELQGAPAMPGAAWALLLVAASEPLAEVATTAPARAAAETEAAAIVQLLLAGGAPAALAARWHPANGEVQADGEDCSLLQMLLGGSAGTDAAPAPVEEEALEGGWL